MIAAAPRTARRGHAIPFESIQMLEELIAYAAVPSDTASALDRRAMTRAG
jgi:hypothetical protein